MSFKKTLQVAWEGLMMNKVRSFLTTLGVIIGVAAVIIMLAVSAGAEAEIADQINALGANLIMVMPSFQRGGVGGGQQASLTYEDLPYLEANVDGVAGVTAEQTSTQDVKADSTTVSDAEIVGTTYGVLAVRELAIADGRFVTDDDTDRTNKVAVLGCDIAVELFGNASPIGEKIKIGSTQFTVVGVMAEKGVVGNTDYDSRIFVPITAVFKYFTEGWFRTTDVRQVMVSAVDRDSMDQVMADLNDVIMQLLGTTADSPGFSMMTQDSIIDAQSSTTETFRNLLGWVAGVSLVVGGIGIMNIMLVSVTERTREIGLRQALGARPRDVQLQFLLEAIILSLLGGLAGVLAGVGGSEMFNALGTMRTEIVWTSVPLAFIASAVVGVFFGYYPAQRAAKLDPIVALRRE